jgi:hypothetical protein
VPWPAGSCSIAAPREGVLRADRVFRGLLLALAAGALGMALVVALTGGIDTPAFRARGAARPFVAGIVFAIAYVALERRAAAAALREPAATLARAAPWIAALAALSVTTIAIRHGAFVAGGSDAYGYLSEAYGWARGELPRPYAIPLTLPVARSDWLQTPLGYWPGTAPHTIVPSYAPGLPLLMAMAIRIANPIGPYLLVPLSAGLFVWGTFLLGRRMAGSTSGLAAALLAATSPIALFMSLQPMSDVPSAAIWTGAAAAASGRTRRDTIVAGLCAALGILVRPNLVPLAILPLAFHLKRGFRLKAEATKGAADEWRLAAIYCAMWLPAAIAIAALNTYWYGSPFLSGYGDPHALYSVGNVWPNLRHYGWWLLQSQSAWIAVSLAALLRPPPMRAPLALAWAFALVTLIVYLPYERYELWWYLRFLLPGMGPLFALVAAGLVTVARGARKPWGAAAACAIFAPIAWHAVVFASALEMWGPLKASEHKYADVGTFIARRSPPNAVFFAMQHSGSIRYYGGRHTLRYDLLDADAARRVPADLERMGLHPYLAIEDAELADVRRVFGLPADRPVPWPYVARLNRFGVSILDLAAHPSGDAPVPIEPGLAPPYAPPADVIGPVVTSR